MATQIFFIFTPTWGRFPFWSIFFRWVETTNQTIFFGVKQLFLKPSLATLRVLEGDCYSCWQKTTRAVSKNSGWKFRNDNWTRSTNSVGGIFHVFFCLGWAARWYCWWLRNPKANHRLDVWNPVNNGMNYQPQPVQDFFHQPWDAYLSVGASPTSGTSTKKDAGFLEFIRDECGCWYTLKIW